MLVELSSAQDEELTILCCNLLENGAVATSDDLKDD
jgi:hypothetical protein